MSDINVTAAHRDGEPISVNNVDLTAGPLDVSAWLVDTDEGKAYLNVNLHTKNHYYEIRLNEDALCEALIALWTQQDAAAHGRR